MNKILKNTSLSLCFIFLVSHWYANTEMSCEYASKFQECLTANQNGSTRGIEDFVCISSPNNEEILDQIILDVEFKKIDEKVENFLARVKQDKEASALNSNEVIDEISNNLVPPTGYYNEYKDLCNGWILAKRAECMWPIPNTVAWLRIDPIDSDSACMNLVRNKLDIYSNVAYDTMKLNKSDVREDRLQEWVVQELRTKYDGLINLMTAILWNIWRLARGVTHWTPNPL